MASSRLRILAADDVARATAELIFALQKELPQAERVPCEAIEGEAIHLEVRLPSDSETVLGRAQDRVLDLKHGVEDRYGLYVLVRLLPVAGSDRN